MSEPLSPTPPEEEAATSSNTLSTSTTCTSHRNHQHQHHRSTNIININTDNNSSTSGSSSSKSSRTSSEETCQDNNSQKSNLSFFKRQEERFLKGHQEESVSSWTTTTTDDEDEDSFEGSENSEEDESISRPHRRKSRHKKTPTKSRSPSPTILLFRKHLQLHGTLANTNPKQVAKTVNISSAGGSDVRRPHHYQSLPLRTQIRLLIERALSQQLLENNSANPRRNWLRRQIDTAFLRCLVFIMRYHRELFLLFLVFISTLASLRTSPIKTRATPDPKPFFDNPKSLQYIDDYYRGEYMDLVKHKINLGPAFVFYYAPWDSESVQARNVFVNVARYFRYTLPQRIRFYAVNCWWPLGECRKNYKNLSHFPIFVAHVQRNLGIIYSGPIRAELIIKFLTSILKPLTRIDTEDELWRYRAQHDAIMLGYFNFTDSESIRDYETYRQMALRSFESDPFGQIGYGMFLKQDLALKYFLTSSNVISLVLFNEIHTAKWTGERDETGSRGPVAQVANWVVEKTKKTPITWAYQIRTGFANRAVALGPMDLVDELSKGPVLLLITRRYFPSSYSPFYAQVKEVALDYFNCNKSGNVTRLRNTTHQINSEWMTLFNSVSKLCEAQLGPPTDTCILLKDQLKHWAAKRGLLKRESLASYNGASASMNFTGFACASDRVFKFFAIDPVDMPYFVELGFGGLGNGFHNDSDPVLLIIDAQNDMILPFSNLNITQIAQVIYNYSNDVESNEDEGTGGNFVSSFWSSKNSKINSIQSSYKDNKDYSFAQELIHHPIKDYEDSIRHSQSGVVSRHSNLVINMNSEDLQKFFGEIDPFHEPILLMLTGKFCGTCGIALTSFVDLARFMADYYRLGINITFAKMDMVQNSLPGNLGSHKIPTFVFFPGNDRTDYRVFSGDEKITSKTLLQFLLSELDPESRIKLSLQSPGCSASLSENSNNCESDSKHDVRKYQAKCVTQEHNHNSSNFTSSSSSAREHCISANKASVADKLQLIFDEIQHGYFSHPQPEKAQSVDIGVDMDNLKTQDLDHLRAMKITLDGI